MAITSLAVHDGHMSTSHVDSHVQTSTTDPSATFDSLDPSTGDVVASYPIHGAADVDAAVARSRMAAGWWAALGFAGRAVRMRKWAGVLTRRMGQLAEVVHAETG